MTGLGADRPRCWWAGQTADYAAYHDEEWGVVRHGDDALFERLCLEAFQAGLSWLTVLRKRAALRAAYDGFVIERVAAYDDGDVARVLATPGVIRNRAKVAAVVDNARRATEVEQGLSALLWSYAPTQPAPRPTGPGDARARSPESTAMAGELKRRGFRFIGPISAHALMQAVGMVDEHAVGCWRAESALTAR